MNFRKISILVVGLLGGFGVPSRADYTTNWPFTDPQKYVVSDTREIGVVDGAARLKLLVDEKLDASVSTYTAPGVSNAFLGLGPDVGITLATDKAGKYAAFGSYTSRILDAGVDGNSWKKIVSWVDNNKLESAFGEIPTNYPGLTALWHFDGTWKEAISGTLAIPGGKCALVGGSRLGSGCLSLGAAAAADVVQTPNAYLGGYTELTMCAWMRRYAPMNAGLFIFGHRDRPTTGFANAAGKLDFRVAVNSLQVDITEYIDRWIFATVTWTKSSMTMKCYINGELKAQQTGNTLNVTLGPQSIGWGASMAYLDECAIFNRQLNDDEIMDLYNLGSNVRLQVRAGTNFADVAAQQFVGPGGDTNSFYMPGEQKLDDRLPFNSFGRYIQYRADFSVPPNGTQTPYLDAVVIRGSQSVVFDNYLADFSQIVSRTNTVIYPTVYDTPYLGLAKKQNGGYFTQGQFLSRVYDGGRQTVWDKLTWRVPEPLKISSDLVGLWHLDGGLGDSGPNGIPGAVQVGIIWDAVPAKLGSAAAYFNGATSLGTIGALRGYLVRSIEFWLRNDNVDDGILELITSGGTNTFVRLSSRMITPVGFVGGAPDVYVNGLPTSRALLPGWNHVAIVSPVSLRVSDFVLGRANGDYMEGAMDEVALYSVALPRAVIKAHLVTSRRAAAGRAKFQVRTGNSLPLTAGFVGPDNLPNAYYLDPTGVSAGLPPPSRYIQYRVLFDGDGIATPTVSDVQISVQGGTNMVDSTAKDFSLGTNVNSETRFCGDEVRLLDQAVVPGLVNTPAADGIDGIWNMDDKVWSVTDPMVGSSYDPKHGTPFGGAKPVKPSKVGERCGDFDGATGYVAINGITLSNDFAVAVWFRTSSPLRAALVSREDARFALEINGNGQADAQGFVSFVINDANMNFLAAAVSSMGNLSDGGWHHAVGLLAGQHAYLFVDGMCVGTANIGARQSLAGGPILVAKHGKTGVFYKGQLDELVVFGRSLTQGDVRQLMAVGASTSPKNQGVYRSVIYDAGQDAIWAYVSWQEEARYGDAMQAGSDPTIVGFWNLDETAGVTAADSNSGTKNDGTVNGIPRWVVGKFGNCLAMDGVNGYVNIADSFTLEPNTPSVEAWVKLTNIVDCVVFDKSNAAGGYCLGVDANAKPYFYVGGNGGVTNKAAGGLLPGKWYHLAGSWDGKVARLFVNGDVAAVKAHSGAIMAAREAVIGKKLQGFVDQVAVFNRPLAAEEVADHARAGFSTLRLQARAGNDPTLESATWMGSDKTPNSYFETSAKTPTTGILPLGRYFQYRAFLSTEDGSMAPKLQGVLVNQSSYSMRYPWIAPAPGAGARFDGRLLDFSHVLLTNQNVKYQITGDATNWYFYSSSAKAWSVTTPGLDTWHLATEEANTVPQIKLGISNFYETVYAAKGGEFRFRAFLGSQGSEPMAIDSVDVRYSEGRVVVTQPNGAEVGEKAWIAGVPYTIRWSSRGRVTATNLVIELWKRTGSPRTVTLATGVRNTPGTNSFTTVISSLPASDYRIRIWDKDDRSIEDYSDGEFEIKANLHLSVPNGGEHWYLTQTNAVSWESPKGTADVNGPNKVFLFFSNDGGVSWTKARQLAIDSTNGIRNTLRWMADLNNPLLPITDTAKLVSENAKMAISEYAIVENMKTGKWDMSDRTFTNAGIVVTYPRKGVGIRMGNDVDLQWTAAGVGTNGVRIELNVGGGFTNIVRKADCVAGVNSFRTQLVAPNPTSGARIRISSLVDSNLIYGVSQPFTLADISIVNPTGGAVSVRSRWQVGSTNRVMWTSGGAGNKVNIKYSLDGVNWTTLANGYTNTDSGATVVINQSAPWIVPFPPSGSAIIRVESSSQLDLYDETEPFDLAGLQVVYPDKPEDRWTFGIANVLRWSQTGAGNEMSIQIAYEDNPSSNDYEMVASNDPLGLGQRTMQARELRRPSNFARIRLQALDPYVKTIRPMYDVSDRNFVIEGVLITTPNSNSVYTLGTTIQEGLQWYCADGGGAPPEATVYYIPNENTTNLLKKVTNRDDGVERNDQNMQPLEALRRLLPSNSARIKLVVGSFSAVSEPFVMRGIRILRPAANQNVDVGAREAILQWRAEGLSASAVAANSVSVNGSAGPYSVANLPQDVYVSQGSASWDVDPELDPTTNAVIRMAVTSPSNDTDVVMYSDPFTLKGLKFKSPDRSTVWRMGVTQQVAFLSAGLGSNAVASVYYAPDASTFDMNHPIIEGLAIHDGLNIVDWSVENAIAFTRMPSTNAHLLVVSGSYTNVSKAFTLRGIKVTSPQASDIWALTDIVKMIRWVSVDDPVRPFTLQYTVWGDSGTNPVTQKTIATGVVGNSYTWEIMNKGSNAVGSNVTITVSTPSFSTTSERFEVVSAPSIRIISPKVGDFLKVDGTNTIVWSRGGTMSNEFTVSYSTEPYNETNLLKSGLCDIDVSKGLFSFVWRPIPPKLGRTRIIITNWNDRTVKTQLEGLRIAPRFRISKFPAEVYALQPISIQFSPRGYVSAVDFYYNTDPSRASNRWVRINAGAFSDNVEHDAPASYDWQVVNLRAETVYLRVQDHAYPDTKFGINKPGPFDDMGPFKVRYYQILWHVLNATNGQHMTQLSVSDSSGWSAAGLVSPVTREYPYGNWDTVWSREFFKDAVVFNWSAKPSRTIEVRMAMTEQTVEYHVLGNFAYDWKTKTFTIHSWLERSGAILTTAERSRVVIYDSVGKSVETVNSQMRMTNGVFLSTWNASKRNDSEVLFARVEVDFSGVTYSSGLTFSLLRPASDEGVKFLSDLFKGFDAQSVVTNIVDIRTSIADTQGDVRRYGKQSLKDLTNLTTIARTTSNLVNRIEKNVALVTNVLPDIRMLTNQMVSVVAPGISTLTNRTARMEEDQQVNRARILTRPTMVDLGSTNTILYKSMKGFGETTKLKIWKIPLPADRSVPALYSTNMGEVAEMGVYSADVPFKTSWGIGSYMVECLDPDEKIGDHMIVQVVKSVTGADDLKTLQDTVNKIDTNLALLTGDKITNIVDQVLAINGAVSDLMSSIVKLTTNANVLASLTNVSTQVESVKKQLDEGFAGMTAGVARTYGVVTGLQINVNIITGRVGRMEPMLAGVTNRVARMETVVTGKLAQVGARVEEISGEVAGVKADVAAVSVTVGDVKTQVEGVKSDVAVVKAAVDAIDFGTLKTDVATIRTTIEDPAFAAMATRIQDIATQLGNADLAQMASQMADLKTQVGATDFAALSTSVDTITAAVAGGNLAELSDKVDSMASQMAAADFTNLTATVNNFSEQIAGADLAGLSTMVRGLADAFEGVDVVGMASAVQDLATQMNSADLAGISDNVATLTAEMQRANFGNLNTTMSELSAKVKAVDWKALEQEVGSLSASVKGADLSGLSQQVSAMSRNLGQVDFSRVDLEAMQRTLGSMNDLPSQKSLFGQINGVMKALEKITESTSGMSTEVDAAKRNAQTAKTEAGNAVSAIERLRAEVAKGDLGEAMKSLQQLQSSLAAAQRSIGEINRGLGYEQMYKTMQEVAATMREFANSKGIKMLMDVKELPGGKLGLGGGAGAGGAGADEEIVTVLNKNMTEIKDSMSFMEKLVDEMRNEPVVEETLLGVEEGAGE